MKQIGVDWGFDRAMMMFYDGHQYLRWIKSVWWKPWTWNRNWGKWGL